MPIIETSSNFPGQLRDTANVTINPATKELQTAGNAILTTLQTSAGGAAVEVSKNTGELLLGNPATSDHDYVVPSGKILVVRAFGASILLKGAAYLILDPTGANTVAHAMYSNTSEGKSTCFRDVCRSFTGDGVKVVRLRVTSDQASNKASAYWSGYLV